MPVGDKTLIQTDSGQEAAVRRHIGDIDQRTAYKSKLLVGIGIKAQLHGKTGIQLAEIVLRQPGFGIEPCIGRLYLAQQPACLQEPVFLQREGKKYFSIDRGLHGICFYPFVHLAF